jgi:hypothetical protein
MLKITTSSLLLSLAATPLTAQCKVAIGSHEGQLLSFHTVPMVFSFPMIWSKLSPGSVRFGVEGDYLPKPNAELQETSLCYVRKQENTSLSQVFGRPRLTVGLPYGFAIEGSYLPEVHVSQAKASSAGIALSYELSVSKVPGFDGGDLIFRAHWSTGAVHGPITCSSDELQTTSPTTPCYATQPSNDTFHPVSSGLELVFAATPRVHKLGVYAGIGADRIESRFQVGFTDVNGRTDSTRVQLKTPLLAGALLAGASMRHTSHLETGFQVYSVPGHSTTFRVAAAVR